jgi:uncharacterized membrane protein YdbT with pleckstrin-like domain
MDLHPGERVIYEGHPSWRSTIGFYLVGVLVAAAVGAAAFVAASAGLGVAVGVGVLAIVLLVGWLKRITTRYWITTRRLQIRRGIIARNVEETRVERIVDVNVRQSVLERVLRIGTVNFDNAGGQTGDDFRFVGIASPGRVTGALNEVHEESARQGARPETSI